MARALDWETANRNDRAHKENIESATPSRKGSNIDLAKRLETAIKLIESEHWTQKKAGIQISVSSANGQCLRKDFSIQAKLKIKPIRKKGVNNIASVLLTICSIPRPPLTGLAKSIFCSPVSAHVLSGGHMKYRIFIINSDNSIDTISQKSFDDFSRRDEPALTRYAGQEIHLAMVFYTLRDKKPDQIIKIDSFRLTVKSDGSIDHDRRLDALGLAINLIAQISNKQITSTPSKTVIDAKSKFDERRRAQYNPEISVIAINHILQKLFRYAT